MLTPDTLDYMIGGYAVSFTILALILVSIAWRYRSLTVDDAALDAIASDSQNETPAETHTSSEKSANAPLGTPAFQHKASSGAGGD